MALIVTYSSVFSVSDPQHVYAPVMVGSKARTERIVMSSASVGSTAGSLSCASDECIVDIYAQADCWVQVGPTPVAETEGATSRFMAAGERAQYWVEAGAKVAGIEQ